jgi:hypothetical protein
MLCAVTLFFCFTHQQVSGLVFFMIHVEPFFFEMFGVLSGASYYIFGYVCVSVCVFFSEKKL